MTERAKSKLSVWIAGISSFVAWLVSLPPENQDAVIKPLIELSPIGWRPTIGLISRALATGGMIYAAYKTHSAIQNPQEPPK
jgi:hypothetical protein